jgi:hypothetical protein
MNPDDHNTNKFRTNVLSIQSTEIVHNVSDQDTDVNSRTFTTRTYVS